jgi:hypothetical protein
MSASTALLWLFVIFLGITFGAGIYEKRIVVPRWLSSSGAAGRHWNAEAARQDDTGRRFWAFVTTGLSSPLRSKFENVPMRFISLVEAKTGTTCLIGSQPSAD